MGLSGVCRLQLLKQALHILSRGQDHWKQDSAGGSGRKLGMHDCGRDEHEPCLFSCNLHRLAPPISPCALKLDPKASVPPARGLVSGAEERVPADTGVLRTRGRGRPGWSARPKDAADRWERQCPARLFHPSCQANSGVLFQQRFY